MEGRIRQRTPGTWQVSIDLPRSPTGRRRTRAETIPGTKAQARRKLREMLTARDKGQNPVPANLTLGEWLDRWMAEKIVPPKCKQRTKETYRNVIDRHIAPHLGNQKLSKVGPVDVQELEDQLSTHLSPKMVNQVHIVLSGAFKHALRMELIYRNPVALVSAPSVKRPEIDPPEVSSVRTMLEQARQDGHILYPAMHLIAYTGMRRGEGMGLRWQNVNLEEGTIRVEISRVQSRVGIIQESPKTDSGRRTINLDAGTVEVLRDHRERQLEMREQMGELFHDGGWVFADELGNPINPKQLYDTVKRYGHRVGDPRMTVHNLRHFHASMLLKNRENPVVVSKRLGHSKVSITLDVYAHVLPGWQQEAADSFAEAMEKGD